MTPAAAQASAEWKPTNASPCQPPYAPPSTMLDAQQRTNILGGRGGTRGPSAAPSLDDSLVTEFGSVEGLLLSSMNRIPKSPNGSFTAGRPAGNMMFPQKLRPDQVHGLIGLSLASNREAENEQRQTAY